MNKKVFGAAFVFVLLFAVSNVFAQSGGSGKQIEYSVVVTYIPYTRTDSGRDAQRSSTSDRSGTTDRSGSQSEWYNDSNERSNSRENSSGKESERSFTEQSGKQMEIVINVWASSVAEAEKMARDEFFLMYKGQGSIENQLVGAKVKKRTFVVTIRYTVDKNDPLVVPKKITVKALSAEEAEQEAKREWEKTKAPGNVFKGISSQKQK
ncbi:MAG: hypothetical protein FWG13_05285 [Leptospirales bacterium]|nr:hypothetical protein [Leptospirales bacterium]